LIHFEGGLFAHVREITPKDLYFAQVIRQTEKSFLLLIERMVLTPEVFDYLTPKQFRSMLDWVMENLLEEKVLTVENWLELAFHLCKQRWDSSIDWLENQPMSKVMLMLDIVKKHNEQQEDAMKKSARRKK
jgi:hypothetical protein